MPVLNETLARIESLESTTYEGAKVVAVDGVNDFSRFRMVAKLVVRLSVIGQVRCCAPARHYAIN